MEELKKLVFPMFLSTSINVILTFTDTAIVGLIGVNAISAVASGGAIFAIFIQVIGSLIIGLQIHGSKEAVKEKNHLSSYFFQTMLTMYFFVLLFAFIAIFFSDSLVSLFATNETLSEVSMYIWGRLPSLFVFPLSLGIKTTYDVRKKTKIGLYYSIIVGLSNLLLEYLFLIILGIGIFGSGLSDSIALFIGFLYLIFENRKSGVIYFKQFFHKSVRNKKIWKELNKINLPEMANMLFDYLGTSVLMIMMSYIGTFEVAAGKISSIYIKIIFSLALNLGTATQILLLRTEVEKEKRIYVREAFKLSFLLFFSFVLLSFISPIVLALPFTRDEGLLKMLYYPLILVGINTILIPFVTIGTGILRANQKNKTNMWINALSTWLLQVPTAYLFSIVFDLGALGFVISYIFYFLGRMIGNFYFIFRKEKEIEFSTE